MIFLFNQVMFRFHLNLPMEETSPLPNKDLAGVSCQDDSTMGSHLQDLGPGRKSALVYWRRGPTNKTPNPTCSSLRLQTSNYTYSVVQTF